jgi:hypothetical protein
LFHHQVLPVLAQAQPEQALMEQALAAAEVELAPPSYRTLQTLESKRRGLFPTIKRFSFPSLIHLLSRHISWKNRFG